MAEWNSQRWSGQYWGSRKGKARKAQGGGAQQEQKNRQKDVGKFPSYDTMDVEATEQSTGSSSSVACGDQVWQSTLRCLLQSNPGLAIPKEISTALESMPKKDSTTSIGRSKDGSFKTSGLKTYPPGLCTAIALAWGNAYLPQSRTLPGTDASPPSHFAAAFDSLHSAVTKDATFGPDFCTDAQ